MTDEPQVFARRCGFLGLLVGVFASRVAVAAAGGGYCDGEQVEMTAPVVTVLDGPGSAELEQERWPESIPNESTAGFDGPTEMSFAAQGQGWAVLILERQQ